MNGIDLIGDVHGHGPRLHALLRSLGYRERAGAWRHPDRIALFIGDMIDRGPEQREVVDTARAMVDAGSALALMGNHEYNAICYDTPHPHWPGTHIRPRNEYNRLQHEVFLQAYADRPNEHRAVLDWFMTLPLFLEIDGLRAVHACWDATSIRHLRELLDDGNRLNEELLHESGMRGTVAFEAVERILKGPELDMPGGLSYRDKEGTRRARMRVRWWKPGPHTWRSVGLLPEHVREQLPEEPVSAEVLEPYPDGAPPVFFGHYWMNGEPRLLRSNVICLDYSVARGGVLCAYRWDRGAPLSPDRFVWV